MSEAVTLTLGDDGILVATMNLPGRPMNVVGDELMLGIARAVERLADPAYQDATQRFVQASLEGWIYCRDNAQECADIITANGSKLGASHQLWMMNEVNKLIWPSPAGVGIIDPALWEQTVNVAMNTKNLEGATVISAVPTEDAYTNQYAEAANAALTAQGLNTTGDAFAPISVTLTEGGS